MNKDEILETNAIGWNAAAPHFNGVTALPEYGPFIANEYCLKLLPQIAGVKILELGCGAGHSLAYLAGQKPGELWGVDFSSVQIESARNLLTSKNIDARLFVAPMEKDIGLPTNYFDLVISIYALGWTTDLPATLSLISKYLKSGGIFIFSWEHPFYSCLGAQAGNLMIDQPYNTEGSILKKNWKGTQTPIVMQRRKLSTYINEIIKAGLNIESVIEGELADEYKKSSDAFTYAEGWYSTYKANLIPTTIIIKAKKHKSAARGPYPLPPYSTDITFV